MVVKNDSFVENGFFIQRKTPVSEENFPTLYFLSIHRHVKSYFAKRSQNYEYATNELPLVIFQH